MSDVLVRAEGVSKKFCRSLKSGMVYSGLDVLRDTLGLPGHPEVLRKNEFWSLNNVSFELRRGECLGLVGSNGAGKSTLLKILNGIIRPDAGSVTIRGRVGALIEVGAGFHPMLTGRENIYVNGATLGMTSREIDRKLDSIIEFSGLESRILDAPVKSYSSGMYVRLGFAIAVHTEPDVLLVDEILAVGDIRFIGQCRRKIEELRRNGASLIVVSHNLPLVEEVCGRGLMLAKGVVQVDGPVQAATAAYRRYTLEQSRQTALDRNGNVEGLPSLNFVSGVLVNDDGTPAESLRCGDVANLNLTISTEEEVRNGILSIWIVRQDDDQVTGLQYLEVGKDLPPLRGGDLRLRFRCQVIPGDYRLGVTYSTDGQYGLVDQFMPCSFHVEPPEGRLCPPLGVYVLDVWHAGAAGEATPAVSIREPMPLA